MGRVEGKVALVTGAARGRGRSHAVRLAWLVSDEARYVTGVTFPSTPASPSSRRCPLWTIWPRSGTWWAGTWSAEHQVTVPRVVGTTTAKPAFRVVTSRLLPVRHHRDVAPALSRAFAA